MVRQLSEDVYLITREEEWFNEIYEKADMLLKIVEEDGNFVIKGVNFLNYKYDKDDWTGGIVGTEELQLGVYDDKESAEREIRRRALFSAI